jgi:hypothetical protein
MTGTYFKPGDYNIIDDRTGRKIKASTAQNEWTGSTVHRSSFEERHPQDYIRSIPDHQAVLNPNPESTDRFLATNQVTTTDFEQTGAAKDQIMTIWDDGNTRFDNFDTLWDVDE